jgi:hypothetical protein
MSNVLSEEKKQQVTALGKLGWPLRRIAQATGVRRETAGAYLKAAGIGVRLPGAWGRRAPAKPANEVIPDPGPSKPAIGVTPDFIAPFSGKQGAPNDPSPPSASVGEQAEMSQLQRSGFETVSSLELLFQVLKTVP